ncbi:hypothetical protein IV38_GL000780 [Lactobacillus selangorensis]|uniref:Integral membrane protein n=1 Tax=Lactobacillus selangorensis TaxID=81857 RepID=A0A0R2FXB5_9LACO|nr:ECF transporter S component [Lactobacillus selangorensis]KRN28581.1 hypothetical protein IV38_GL000780 [Lactobacillus selangorensis]KRN33009.1 hypothetical protein IV40_GL001073 [Lactobacillus selangorensis]
MDQGKNNLRKVIFTGLWAAIIYIGIWLLRIPVPAPVGNPFIHFGNALTVLAVLFLGTRDGMIAGAIGLGGFDVLNGYAATSWLTVLEVVVLASVVGGLFKLFHDQDRPTWHIIVIGIAAGLTKIVTSYLVSIVEALMAGTAMKVAVVAAFVSLPATVINSISTAIIVPILYYILKRVFKSIRH